jgi:hypothetical protein
MRDLAPHFPRRLVLAQPLIDDLAQQVVLRPGEKFDLGDELGAHPMHPAENQRRAEAGAARRGDAERHRSAWRAAAAGASRSSSAVLMPVPTRPAYSSRCARRCAAERPGRRRSSPSSCLLEPSGRADGARGNSKTLWLCASTLLKTSSQNSSALASSMKRSSVTRRQSQQRSSNL